MKILNKSQAEAVYSAMCALNNVDFRACDLSFSNAIVKQASNEAISVIGPAAVDDEIYQNQAEFAAAYGLDGEPEMVQYLGRKFKVLAKFPEADSDAANAFMEANPNAGLLCIENGIAYLADMADEGVLA